MRFEYTVTKDDGSAEIMQAMSYKKFKKSLLMKYPKFNGYCTYTNKKGNMQTKSFKDGNLN